MDHELGEDGAFRPRSRPWLTLALAMVVGVASAVTQGLALGVYLFVEKGRNREFDMAKWVETAHQNGVALTIASWAGTAIAVPLIFLFARLVSREPVAEYLGLRWPSIREVGGWVLGTLAFIGFADLLTWSVGRDIVPSFMRETYLTAGHPVFLWLALLVAAPITEELMFRAFLFEGLVRSRLGAPGAAIVTSLAWALLHVQYDLTGIVTVFTVGILFAAARQMTRSLILCMLMHATMNLVATLEVVYVLRMEGAS